MLIDDYFSQALKLLPRGIIWARQVFDLDPNTPTAGAAGSGSSPADSGPGQRPGRLAASLWMAAGGLAGAHRRAENLINEADPQTARELIREWEDFAGLPDECTPARDLTLAERQDAVVEKLTGLGSLSVESFYRLARILGYEITIREYRPFITGRSRAGRPDVLGSTFSAQSQDDVYYSRFYWKVTVHGPRLHWFRCGRNAAGERLGWLTPARDLECFFNRRKPAHTIIIFDYQEVLS